RWQASAGNAQAKGALMIARALALLALVLASGGPAFSQGRMDADQMAGSLQGIEAAPQGFSAALLRQQALSNIRSHTFHDPRGRPPLSEQLNRLAHVTVTVQFDFNSARIRPESYRTLALI